MTTKEKLIKKAIENCIEYETTEIQSGELFATVKSVVETHWNTTGEEIGEDEIIEAVEEYFKNANETKIEKSNGSIYVLSNIFLNEEEVFDQLDTDDQENAEFIEYDKAVASHYGYKHCAIFHSTEI